MADVSNLLTEKYGTAMINLIVNCIKDCYSDVDKPTLLSDGFINSVEAMILLGVLNSTMVADGSVVLSNLSKDLRTTLKESGTLKDDSGTSYQVAISEDGKISLSKVEVPTKTYEASVSGQVLVLTSDNISVSDNVLKIADSLAEVSNTDLIL